MSVTIKATRTCCLTGNVTITDIELEIRKQRTWTSPWIWISKGGVTGFEGFEMKDEVIARVYQNGWGACGGTPGKWDTLVISAEEMQKALAVLAEEPIPNT